MNISSIVVRRPGVGKTARISSAGRFRRRIEGMVRVPRSRHRRRRRLVFTRVGRAQGKPDHLKANQDKYWGVEFRQRRALYQGAQCLVGFELSVRDTVIT